MGKGEAARARLKRASSAPEDFAPSIADSETIGK
jgi:hypothetical protein